MTGDEARATEILADFRERRERGEPVDPDDVVRAHPDLADRLRGRLAALAKLDRAFGHDAAPAAPPLTGKLLGPYRLGAALGTGGMGTVYLAEVEGRAPGVAAGARVAVKVVHPHLLLREGFFKRFLREAEIGRRLRHDNVVRTYDADAVPLDGAQAHFLVLEYVEGQTLRGLLAEVERVPEELCRHIGREVAKALVAIHSAGAVHRDLKPDNVLITGAHEVKVMDLGVARHEDDWQLSQTGAFVGSVRYAAPEQFGLRSGDPGAAARADPIPRSSERHARGAKGDPPASAAIDPRADLYSLGLVLYELATGAHPFSGDDFHAVMRRQLTETPRPAGEVNPQLSPFFEELLKVLLRKDPAERFASAEDLLAALTEGEKSAWWHERAIRVRAETKRPLRRIRIPRETALYGREAEIALLRERFALATEGDGQVVFVEGEAGIGKSRLVDEFVGLLQREGEDVHFLFGSYPPGGAATASGAFSTAYREHFGEETLEDALREALPVTPLLVPAFAALLRGDAAPKDAEPLTKDSLQTVFVHATRSLAKERTTIVLIDDLHFAPEEGRGLFASLALATPGHRILLVGTARPGLPQDWLVNVERTAHVTRLPLARLGPKDLGRLLADTLKSERLAEELAGRIGMKSDGNPFFVFEILRGLREGQFLTQKADGTWATTQILHDIQVPSTIQDLVRARIGDLDPDDKDLLDVASCLGFEFDAGVVSDALGSPRLPVLRRLARIEARHRLVRADGRRFVFDHHQVQETLYGALPEQLREEYHAAIAAALEAASNAAATDPETLDGTLCVGLCEHFLRAGQGARALRYLDAAQTHLERGYLHARVVALTERALAVSGLLVGSARARTLLRLAAALAPMGRRVRWEECAREAESLAEVAHDDEARGRAAAVLGNCLFRTARHADAEAAQRRALEIAVARGDRAAEARAIGDLGNVHAARSRVAEAIQCLERQRAISREIADPVGEARAEGNLGVVHASQGRRDEARDHYERSLAISRRIGDLLGEALVTGNLGNACREQGRLTEAKQHHERARALCRAIGERTGEASACRGLALDHIDEGRYPEAQAHLEQSLAVSRETGDDRAAASAEYGLGVVCSQQGRVAEARGHLEQCLSLARVAGDRDREASALGALGAVSYSQDHLADAREYYERALALSRETVDRGSEAVCLVNLAPTWHALGNRAAALAALTESLRICREIGAPRPECHALASIGAVAEEDGDRVAALARTREAIALSRACGYSVLVAESLRQLGGLCLRAGDADGARTALEEGAELSRAQGRWGAVAGNLAILAQLPGGDAKAAREALAEAGESAESRELRLQLWKATRDRAELAAAKRLLDELLAKNPPEYHESMLRNVRVNREIMAACREQGLA